MFYLCCWCVVFAEPLEFALPKDIFICIKAIELLSLAEDVVHMSSQLWSGEKVVTALRFRSLCKCSNRGTTPKVSLV